MGIKIVSTPVKKARKKPVREIPVQKVIRRTVEFSEGGLSFEDLIGRLPDKYGKLPQNPDELESIINSMTDVKILRYHSLRGLKRFVYLPVI